ncbi:hypothetical protein H5407_02380 [Mitsuaria sp. WAJ17]|uniref:hypothetical protein n=1 Tax=Mitsuaria sp. WAJ17 TaxID=2761452 RepID=UPI0016000D4A|nr:hypothetical protein [Mitsuaria sp. WAJ17]MBB2484064.1 hypothetical protein [Mitsuaria sp. WAJ17]
MALKLLLLFAMAWPGLLSQAAESAPSPASVARASVASQERLIWAGAPYAPMVIREGSLRGRGYVDRMLAEVLQPSLPQFSHETLHVSPMRLDRELRESDQAVCSAAFSRTPLRMTRYAFTAAIFRFLPVGVVMRRDHVLAPPRRPQPLSLQALLDRGMRLGLVGYRAHGGAVDLMLGAHAAQVQRFVLNTSNQSVLAMLARSHAMDATLVYEFELSYFKALQPELGEQLGWWPLEELDESQLSYIACSANPAGRRAVLTIDRLLAQPGVRDRLQSLYEQWLDEGSRRRLKELRQRMGPLFWRDPKD